MIAIKTQKCEKYKNILPNRIYTYLNTRVDTAVWYVWYYENDDNEYIFFIT